MIMDVFSIPEKQKSSMIALKIMRWSKEGLKNQTESARLIGCTIKHPMIQTKIVSIKFRVEELMI